MSDTPLHPARTVYLETFGCQMNELDSELVVGQLSGLGYRFTTDADAADVVLYNTCSVREHAEQKVWSRLGQMKDTKAEKPGLVVGVLGCMAERDGTDLIDRMPVVDLLCGPAELDKLPGLLDNAVRTRASMVADDAGPKTASKTAIKTALKTSANQVALQGSSSRRTSTLSAAADTLEMLDLSRAVSPTDANAGRSAYVRITRGCNKFCTYCVVPFTRGAEVHRPPDNIVDECKKLADAGVIEITLLGQTVNHYRFEHGAAVTVDGVTQPQKGRAFKGGHRRDPLAGANTTTFADLLRRIHDEVPAIERIRFVTSYPRDFGDDVLEVIRDHPRLCRYIHVPGQTGSDRMLKMMNRGYTVGEYNDFIDRCKHYLDQPELGRPLMLSGDIIVGFPTETDADFEQTVGLVERTRYKNCFIFKYSPRPGTTAYDKIPDDIPDRVKRERNNRLLGIQNAISAEIVEEQVGRAFDVLIEGFSRRERKKRGEDTKVGKGMVSLTVGGRKSLLGGNAAENGDTGGDHASPHKPAAGPTNESTQLAARTDGDLIVHLTVPAGHPTPADDLIGRIRRVRITAATGLTCDGELVED